LFRVACTGRATTLRNKVSARLHFTSLLLKLMRFALPAAATLGMPVLLPKRERLDSVPIIPCRSAQALAQPDPARNSTSTDRRIARNNISIQESVAFAISNRWAAVADFNSPSTIQE
jgi:hypothetical protein